MSGSLLSCMSRKPVGSYCPSFVYLLHPIQATSGVGFETEECPHHHKPPPHMACVVSNPRWFGSDASVEQPTCLARTQHPRHRGDLS
eukprot:COSAG01_NODE_3664_length_5814_cov_15.571829_3_plen_87_part_00